jgi:hypothetical protein
LKFEPPHKLGGPGTGKTHLATSLGVQAIRVHGKRVRFFSTVELVNALELEKAQNKTGQMAYRLMYVDMVILPAADIQVIRRGKALEYFSRHYGKVYVDEGRAISVKDALVGINQLIDEDADKGKEPPPVNAEPITRQFLRTFGTVTEIKRDQLQKFLKGSITTPDEFEQRGWCSEKSKVFTRVNPLDFARDWSGKHKRRLTSDLDQALVMIGEFLALAVSLEDLGLKTHNNKAKLLAKTLDATTGKLLDNNKNPSPKTGQLDNRGSQFYLAMYWAQELAAQTEDQALAAQFAPLAKQLSDQEAKIVEELAAVQDKPADIGGYHLPDSAKLQAIMCPSQTFNAALSTLA